MLEWWIFHFMRKLIKQKNLLKYRDLNFTLFMRRIEVAWGVGFENCYLFMMKTYF